MDSILTSIKKLLGIEDEYTHFDPDIILSINSVFLALNQLGIGPSIGFMIKDSTKTWVDLIGDREDIESVKLYVYFKVRLMFDPPANSFLIDAMERQTKELEWRLMVQVDPPIVDPPIEEGGIF